MRFVICVRNNVNWLNITPETFFEQPRRYKPNIEKLRSCNLIAKWEKAFKLSYGEFRYALREIAQSSLKEVYGFEVIQDVEYLDELIKSKEEAILAAIDDDDWFAPDIKRLACFLNNSSLQALVWSHLLYVGNNFFSPTLNEISKPFFFRTNNFMIRKSFLVSSFGERKTKYLLANHSILNDNIIGDRRNLSKMRFFQHNGNVSSKHAGCITQLWASIEKPDPIKYLKDRARLFVNGCNIPKTVLWCTPYVQQTIELHKKLLGGEE